jgi:two-component SAPR family response regulator
LKAQERYGTILIDNLFTCVEIVQWYNDLQRSIRKDVEGSSGDLFQTAAFDWTDCPKARIQSVQFKIGKIFEPGTSRIKSR